MVFHIAKICGSFNVGNNFVVSSTHFILDRLWKCFSRGWRLLEVFEINNAEKVYVIYMSLADTDSGDVAGDVEKGGIGLCR